MIFFASCCFNKLSCNSSISLLVKDFNFIVKSLIFVHWTLIFFVEIFFTFFVVIFPASSSSSTVTALKNTLTAKGIQKIFIYDANKNLSSILNTVFILINTYQICRYIIKTFLYFKYHNFYKFNVMFYAQCASQCD